MYVCSNCLSYPSYQWEGKEGMAVLAVQGLEREKNNVERSISCLLTCFCIWWRNQTHLFLDFFWTQHIATTAKPCETNLVPFVIFRLKIWLSALAVVIAAPSEHQASELPMFWAFNIQGKDEWYGRIQVRSGWGRFGHQLIIFRFFFVKKSFICLEGKLMTPRQKSTFLFRSSQQLPHSIWDPLRAFLADTAPFKGIPLASCVPFRATENQGALGPAVLGPCQQQLLYCKPWLRFC